MQPYSFLNKSSVCIDTTSQSKTAVFLKISRLLNKQHPELDTETLFDAYWKRETMGSMAIGHGILIPHIRTPLIQKTAGCLLKLQHPVDFGADDKQPIDIVLALLVPQHQTDQHLQLLSQLIKQFSILSFRRACRNVKDSTALYALFTSPSVTERCAEDSLVATG